MTTKPAFVLWTGDTIYGKDPSNRAPIDQEYAAFLNVAKTGGVPVYNAPGNHEMDDSENCPNSSMLSWYLADMPMGSENYAFGSFNYGNSHFVALNSDDGGGSPGSCDCKEQPEGDKPPGFISKKQRELLEDDLKNNTSAAHVFIFLHRPLKGYKSKHELCERITEDLEKKFKKFSNLSYVVAGHEHMYYYPKGDDHFSAPPQRTDPGGKPTYLVAGGAGAPLEDTKDAFYHYLIFSVNGNTVNVQLVVVASGSFSSATSSQDVTLANLAGAGTAVSAGASTSAPLTCATYPVITFTVQRSSGAQTLGTITTNQGSSWSNYSLSPNSLLTSDEVQAQITTAGSNCTNEPIGVTFDYIPSPATNPRPAGDKD